MNEYFVANDLLPRFLSAYRKWHSTETAILCVWSDCLMAADRRHVTLSLLDISTASTTQCWIVFVELLRCRLGLDWVVSVRLHAADCIQWSAVIHSVRRSARLRTRSGAVQSVHSRTSPHCRQTQPLVLSVCRRPTILHQHDGWRFSICSWSARYVPSLHGQSSTSEPNQNTSNMTGFPPQWLVYYQLCQLWQGVQCLSMDAIVLVNQRPQTLVVSRTQSSFGKRTFAEAAPWHLNSLTFDIRQRTCSKVSLGGHLKMIGKGFVLFKINSSPSAFYIIRHTCISWLVFKVSKCLKNCRKLRIRKFVYVAEWWRHVLAESKHPARLCRERR